MINDKVFKPFFLLFLIAFPAFANFPVTITDDKGQTVIIKSEPKRIISLAPSNTEILFAIGLEERIVGVTDYCNYPKEAKKKEKIGGFDSPNLEKILFLKPDLVLAGGGVQKELTIKLREFGIPVITLYPENVKQVFDGILVVGKATGKEAEAQKYAKELQDRIKKIQTKSASLNRPKVYFEIWNSPFTSIGKDAFVNELITIAGGTNIFGDIDKTFPEISAEEIIKKNPDLIITAYMEKKGKIAKEVKERSGWSNITAVKDNKVFDDIDSDLLLRSGPRLVLGIEELFKRFHPKISEKFK